MNINLFNLKRLSNTAKIIQNYVQENSHHGISLYDEAFKFRRTYPLPHIRWGATFSIRDWSKNADNLDTINRSDVIAMSQRIRFSELMVNKGIRCIHYRRGMPSEDDYPVIVRTLLNASEGDGIVICRNQREFLPFSSNWWAKWVVFDSECGVHVLGGQIARKFKKVPIEIADEIEFPIKNSTRGYRFSLMSKELPRLKAFIESVQAVYPLDFGRYDVGWIASESKWCLIEANTAPSLSHNANTLKAYCDYFIKIFLDREEN